MIAETVSVVSVLTMMRFLQPFSLHAPQYPEIATAIATASNHDPLFPHRKDGCERTAAILVAIAWHESRFHPNANGDNGQSLGLFQIQPPTARVDGKLLLLPRTASYIAIDLIRTSFQKCEQRPWGDKLVWYAASGHICIDHPVINKQSRDRMATADRVFKKVFPERPLLLSAGENSSTKKEE